MTCEVLFVIVDPEALMTFVSIQTIFILERWSFVDIKKMTIEGDLCFGTEVAINTFELPRMSNS